MSFSRAMRATSRRMGLNPDSTTASGVSSMMTSTPVACSKARMFRPSRPMIRPFISSEGSCTTDTVVSAVVIRGHPLDGEGQDLLPLPFRGPGRFFLDVPEVLGCFGPGFVQHGVHELLLGLFAAESPARALQTAPGLGLQGKDILGSIPNGLLLAIQLPGAGLLPGLPFAEAVELSVQELRSLVVPPLQPFDFLPAAILFLLPGFP